MGGMVNTGYRFKPLVYGKTNPSFRFSSADDESVFKSLTDGKSLSAGQYFGDYAVVNAGSNYIPPGYELAGEYMASKDITNPWSALHRDKIQWPFSPSLQIVKKKAQAPTSAPVTPAPPIDLPNNQTPSNPTTPPKIEEPVAPKPPVQDFRLDEQAVEQRLRRDALAAQRASAFQSLLNSISV